jgi:Type IV secretion system pilin
MPASLCPRRRRPPADRSRSPRRRTLQAARIGRRRLPGLAGMGIGAVVVLVVWLAPPAVAQAADPTLEQVIDRLRNVLVGLLVGLATLFLTVGGLRYLFAGGDPGQVEKAKVTLRSAAIGYGLAVLAPVLVRLLRYVVGS